MFSQIDFLTRFLISQLAVFLLTLVASCGGGGSSSASPGGSPSSLAPLQTDLPSLTGDYFPINPLDKWVYKSQTGVLSTVKVTATKQLESQDYLVFLTEEPTKPPTTQYLRKSSSGVSVWIQDNEFSRLIGKSSIEVVKFPMVVGSSFVQYEFKIDLEYDVDDDDRLDSMTVQSVVQIEAVENVVTPSGEFKNAIKVRTTESSKIYASSFPGEPFDNFGTYQFDWYVNGIGVVKSEEYSSDGKVLIQTDALDAYKVGALKSDYTKPKVKPSLPNSQGNRVVGTNIAFYLSKAAEEASINSESVRAFDLDNKPIKGSVRFNATLGKVLFKPDQAFTDGAIIKMVLSSSIVDDLSNALDPVELTYQIDLSPLTIVSRSPEVEQIDVPSNAIVTLLFNKEVEELNDVYFGPSTGGATSNAIVKVVDGRRMILTPTAPLTDRTKYTVWLSSVRATSLDSVFAISTNALQSLSWSFYTKQGGISVPVDVQPLQTNNAAFQIVDLDLDGNQDFVMLSYVRPSTIAEPSYANITIDLKDAAGKTKGLQILSTLIQPSECRETTSEVDHLIVTDLNGDSRLDIVYKCNTRIRIHLQNSVGGFSAAIDTVISGNGSPIAFGDLDNDGRSELGVVTETGALRVYKFNDILGLGLSFEKNQTYSFGQVNFVDINKDGRLDIATSIAARPGENNFGIYYQSSNGGFPTLSYVPSGGQASKVQYVDVNGDGLVDIVGYLNDYSSTFSRSYIGISYQLAGGSFSAIQKIDVNQGAYFKDFFVADINKDGKQDLIGWFGDQTIGLAVYFQGIGSIFTTQEKYLINPASESGKFTIADLDKDGYPEVIISGKYVMANRFGTGAASTKSAKRFVASKNSTAM
jgi:Bacterial Ig-like domain/FG-GAP-like repeat